jgi:nicotinamidase-related amidase
VKKQAIIIVDVQIYMFDPRWPIYNGDAMKSALVTLVTHARMTGIPLVFIRHAGEAGWPDEANTPTWQIIPELNVQPGELIVDKNKVDAFATTDIEKQLRDRGYTDLVFAGFQSQHCILTNSLKAKQAGFGVSVIRDAHSTEDSKDEPARKTIDRVNLQLSTEVQSLTLVDYMLKS